MIKEMNKISFDSMIDKAQEFATVFAVKQPVFSANAVKTTLGFVLEEEEEFKYAETTHDQLDARVDIIYFCMSEACKYGIAEDLKRFVSRRIMFGDLVFKHTHCVARLSELANQDQPHLDAYCACLGEIIMNVVGTGRYGADIELAFELVHKANMDKLAPNKAAAEQSVEAYKANGIEAAYRPVQVQGSLRYVISRVQDSKILKRIGWVAPDLSSCIF